MVLPIIIVVHSPKTKEGLKHLCRLEIQVLFTEISSKQLVFSMIWLMVNLAKRTHSDKVLRGKAFKIASDPKYGCYRRGLASMIYKLFDKKSGGGGVAIEPNYQLANELHNQIIRNFKKLKIYSSFKTIFGA